jgi:hypothetical protein
MEQLALGCAKVDITPKHPVPLAGFAHRKGVFESVDGPLNARILFFEKNGKSAALIVSADLLFWCGDRSVRLKKKLAELWGLDEANILLHATHNHSGPQTSARFTPLLGVPDEEYVAFMEQRVMDGVATAARRLEPVSIERGYGRCELGVNRRKKVDGRIVMAPNPAGRVDPETTVLRFATPDGRLKALLVHYACHPTVSGENVVSPEFPGEAMNALEGKFGNGVVAVYLQGFCGDVRPALVRDGAFYRGGPKEVKQIGRALADEVGNVLSRPMTRLAPGSFEARRLILPLPLQPSLAPEEMAELAKGERAAEPVNPEGRQTAGGSDGVAESDTGGSDHASGTASADKRTGAGAGRLKQLAPDADVLKTWAGFLLSDPDRLKRSTVELDMSYLELADGCSILAVNGEMVHAYGEFVKTRFGKTVLPVGYSNGMIGYVPTAEQLDEGGYEAVDYIYYFGLPSTFSPEAEQLIRDGIVRLVDRDAR